MRSASAYRRTVMGRQRQRLSDEMIALLKENPYVEGVSYYNISYSKAFYREMYRLTQKEGRTATDAYESLGFPTAKLGKDRAKAAAQEAGNLVSDDGRLRVSPGRYNGSIPPEEMGTFDDPEEELAYYKARSIYLDTVNRAQKKTQSRLTELFTK